MSIKGSAIKRDVCREILKDHSDRTELALFLKKIKRPHLLHQKKIKALKHFLNRTDNSFCSSIEYLSGNFFPSIEKYSANSATVVASLSSF